MIIDTFFIDSAKRIRADFLSLSNKLNEHHLELKNLANSFVDVSKKLEKIQETIGKKPLDVIQKDIFSELNFLEDQAKKIEKLVEPLNEKMERLKKEEIDLWEKIKKKYPKVKEDILISEIQKSL